MTHELARTRGWTLKVTDAFEKHPYVTGAVLALLTCAIIVAVHRNSPRTLVSAHGLLHVAVTQELQQAGSLSDLPPANPFFAGERLPYYWFFHWVAARIASFSGLNALLALEFLILVGVMIVWLSAVGLGRRLYGGLVPGLMIGLLAFAGANPLGAPLLGARVLRHGTRLLADDPDYLWGIAHPLIARARLADPYTLYGPLINFFLNITSRPVSLALVLVMILSLIAWFEKRRWWIGAIVVISTGLATSLSPLIGGGAAAALGGSLLLVRWHQNRRSSGEQGPPGAPVVVPAFVGLFVGGLLALPTTYHLFKLTGGGGIGPGLETRTIAAVVASSALLVGMSLYVTLRARQPQRFYLGALTLAGIVLLTGSIAVELPVSNHTNFFHVGMFILAVPAAGIFAPTAFSPSVRRLLITVALPLFLATPALVIYAYTDRPSIPLRTDRPTLQRVPTDGPLAGLYAWVRSETPGDAVFVLDPRRPFVTAVGNFPEFPALTGRAMFTAHRSSYVVDPYEDADLRREIALSLIEGQGIDEGQRDYLRSLNRQIYLVLMDTDDPGSLAQFRSRYGPPVFRNGNIAVFRVESGGRLLTAHPEQGEVTDSNHAGERTGHNRPAVNE